MDKHSFMERVKMHTGLDDPPSLHAAVDATLETLGEWLVDLHAREIARELPPEMSAVLLKHPSQMLDHDVKEFFERVALREGVEVRHAVEHATAICEALGVEVDETSRHHLTADLNEDVKALFQRKSPGSSLPLHQPAGTRPADEGHTLASGRPGSERPLSEANTSGAHSQSVAASDNPHGDTKLSSTHGPSAERKGTTLSSGTPGSHRPLSGV